jgi:hypothetical protein
MHAMQVNILSLCPASYSVRHASIGDLFVIIASFLYSVGPNFLPLAMFLVMVCTTKFDPLGPKTFLLTGC